MPYTPAHPITAIALIKLFPNKFNKTGLVLGTMAPDLQNFIAFRPVDSSFGHSTLGMMTLGLPASILLAFAFHRLVVPAAARYFPEPFRGIAGRHAKCGWRIAGLRGLGGLVASIVIGMYSHLFLDGFTHYGGLMYPLASRAVETMMPGAASPITVLQFGLSVIGIGIELLMLDAFLRRRRAVMPEASGAKPAPFHSRFWLIVVGAAVVATAAAFFAYRPDRALPRFVLSIVAVAPLSGLAIGLLAASALHAAYSESLKRRMRR